MNSFAAKVYDYIKTHRSEVVFVVLITLLAWILRVVCLMNMGALWHDELYSWNFAQKSSLFYTLHDVIKQDIHMPFYFGILHFWLGAFGDTPDSLRFCTLFLSIPLIPLVFYVSKNLFNKITAYFASIFVCLSTFCIYYSTEARFYGLVFVLSLMSAFFFVKMIDNFNKKTISCFIIFAALLFYTFSIAPLLLLIYFLVGIIYLFFYNKQKIKYFIFAYFMLFIVCLPAVYFTIDNIIQMRNALTYYPLDNYIFNPLIIYDILENFFSFENVQIVNRDFITFRNMFDNLDDFRYFAFVFIPVLIGLFGILNSFFTKNKKLILFFVPSMLFLIILFILGFKNLAALQTRYFTIIYPVFACVFCYGLSEFKNKAFSFGLFVLFLYLSLMGLLFSNKTIFFMQKAEMSSLASVQSELNINKDDLLLIPFGGEKLLYYIQNGQFIPFKIDDACVLKDKTSLRFYFGDDIDKLNRNNVKDYLIDEIIKDRIHIPYEKNLYNSYIKNMKKGQKVIYLVFYTGLERSAKEKRLTYNNYKTINMTEFLISKALRDSLLVLNKYLKLEKTHINPDGYTVYVFEKL